jgi:lipopolysaccharide transport system permease protein
VLGGLWSLINPLFHMLIFMFLSRRVLSLQIPNYPAFVFTGVLAWSWLQSSLQASAGAITASRELVRRPGFPTAILPVVHVTTNMIHFLLALPIPLLLLVLRGGRLTEAVLMLPMVLVPQFLLTLGIGYFLAAIQVTFRDTQHLLQVALRLLFYLTPIFYDASTISDKYQIVFDANPMFHLVTAYREILIQGTLPVTRDLLLLAMLGGALFGLGRIVFRRASYRFAEEL